MPFLEKLRTAAESLDPSRRAAVLSLLAGEPERWRQIRALLSGQAAAPVRPMSDVPAKTGPTPSPSASYPALTVGSLKGAGARPPRDRAGLERKG